jgi:beta,beta-carotene 9',10'-dioxygenase
MHETIVRDGQDTGRGASLGYTTLDEEVAIDRLPVIGALPEWLTGTLVRVTPAKYEAGDRRAGHWFDPLAMLNKFSFTGGQVSYANRFLETRDYRHARQRGEWRSVGFATDPCRSIFSRFAALFSGELTDNCNVNVARLGERFVAMTETPMPVEFDPATLETLGGAKFADSLGGHVTTAHPHYDFGRREAVNYVAHFSRKSCYRVYGLPDGASERRLIASLPVERPAYMHSFGMTERYVVLAEFPLVVNPLRLALSGMPFIENYRWEPERGTRFLVVDRESGELRATCEAEPFFAFHHVNAFERGDGELVVDVCAYEDTQIIEGYYLGDDGPVGPLAPAELRRYRLSLDAGTAEPETLAEGHLELPRTDYRRVNGRDYRHAYFAGAARSDGDARGFDRLVKVDVKEGSRRQWLEPGTYPGEPVYVPAPGATREDDGVILSVVLDPAAGRSFLLVLDAGSFEELGRAQAPHHIPFGFHGQYFG